SGALACLAPAVMRCALGSNPAPGTVAQMQRCRPGPSARDSARRRVHRQPAHRYGRRQAPDSAPTRRSAEPPGTPRPWTWTCARTACLGATRIGVGPGLGARHPSITYPLTCPGTVAVLRHAAACIVCEAGGMRLTPTERDRLLIFTAAQLARSRRA